MMILVVGYLRIEMQQVELETVLVVGIVEHDDVDYDPIVNMVWREELHVQQVRSIVEQVNRETPDHDVCEFVVQKLWNDENQCQIAMRRTCL